MMARPFSQAAENNKTFILDILKRHFRDGPMDILEVGSGTGQHIDFFAGELPQHHWQPSDIPDNLAVLEAGLGDSRSPKLATPLALDVRVRPWLPQKFDAVYSANTLHIMAKEGVEGFFNGLGDILRDQALLCVYGPFKYAGEFTTDSNARFDDWLKARDPESGVRDFEWVNRLATAAGLILLEDNPMPANNRLIVWKKA